MNGRRWGKFAVVLENTTIEVKVNKKLINNILTTVVSMSCLQTQPEVERNAVQYKCSENEIYGDQQKRSR